MTRWQAAADEARVGTLLEEREVSVRTLSNELVRRESSAAAGEDEIARIDWGGFAADLFGGAAKAGTAAANASTAAPTAGTATPTGAAAAVVAATTGIADVAADFAAPTPELPRDSDGGGSGEGTPGQTAPADAPPMQAASEAAAPPTQAEAPLALDFSLSPVSLAAVATTQPVRLQ